MKLAYTDINVNDTALISIQFKNSILGIIFGNQFQKPNIDEINCSISPIDKYNGPKNKKMTKVTENEKINIGQIL